MIQSIWYHVDDRKKTTGTIIPGFKMYGTTVYVDNYRMLVEAILHKQTCILAAVTLAPPAKNALPRTLSMLPRPGGSWLSIVPRRFLACLRCTRRWNLWISYIDRVIDLFLVLFVTLLFLV